jgi:glycosyltransferase involved in cell wall biosynthesis
MSSISKRIVFVIKTLQYGGAEKHLQELIRRIENPAIRVTILCYGTDFYTKFFNDQPNVRVIAKQGGEPRGFLAYWSALLSARPDTVVLVKGWSEDFAIHTYASARLSGARHVVAIEHLLAEPVPPQVVGRGVSAAFRNTWGWRGRFLFKKRLEGRLCTRIICVSDGVRKRLVDEYRFPPSKTITILNGVDLKRFSPDAVKRRQFRASQGVRDDDVVLVCACRLSPRKRVDVLLDGLDKIPKGMYAWQCWIIGNGLLESELRTQCARLGLDRHVHFLGFKGDISPYLRAADIYVSTSEKEGFGLSLVEAMGCQLPCIATNIPGHDEIIQHGVNGLLIPTGSPQRVAEAAMSLFRDPDLRLRMGQEARKRVEQHFDLEQCMASIRSVVLGQDSDCIVRWGTRGFHRS